MHDNSGCASFSRARWTAWHRRCIGGNYHQPDGLSSHRIDLREAKAVPGIEHFVSTSDAAERSERNLYRLLFCQANGCLGGQGQKIETLIGYIPRR
jgi:hypothetical protein